eukprot:2540031-Amphidinium_carterae.1
MKKFLPKKFAAFFYFLPEAQPLISLALIGNRFAKPNHLPAWISTHEQPPDMFCASNNQGESVADIFMCGACISILVAVAQARACESRKRLLDVRLFHVRAAWHEASQQMNMFFVASCGSLAVGLNTASHTCTVVLDHLRLHHMSTKGSVGATPTIVMHMWMCYSVSCFHFRHERQTTGLHSIARRARRAKATKQRGWKGPRALPSSVVYSLWFLACVLMSAPVVFYSAVRAVPGFLHMSTSLQWVTSMMVSLWAGGVIGIGLPYLATVLWDGSGRSVHCATLQLVGLFFSSLALPGLAAVLCHAECLGGWAAFWKPCRDLSFSFAVFQLEPTVLSDYTK